MSRRIPHRQRNVRRRYIRQFGIDGFGGIGGSTKQWRQEVGKWAEGSVLLAQMSDDERAELRAYLERRRARAA